MPKRIEISGNALIITDTVTSEILFDSLKKELYYDLLELQDNAQIVITRVNGTPLGRGAVYSTPLTGAVNNLGVAFTKASATTFFRNSLG